MTLTDMQSRILHLLQEPGPDTGQTPSGDYSLATITRDVNIALDEFFAFTGLEPGLADKKYTGTIVAGLDYTLPADLVSLSRMEYTQLTGGVSYARTLQMVSFSDWDSVTGAGATTAATGAPIYYREPYGAEGSMAVRFYPQPVAANVSAGDTIAIYYSGNAGTLVNGTDVPGFPRRFHMAPVFLLLAEYATRKTTNDPNWVGFFERRAQRLIDEAKAQVFDRNRADAYVEASDDAGAFGDDAVH